MLILSCRNIKKEFADLEVLKEYKSPVKKLILILNSKIHQKGVSVSLKQKIYQNPIRRRSCFPVVNFI